MKKKQKKLTVLLPIYKEPNNFVELAINSILNQTFNDFYLYIILDDPTNERLIKLVNEYTAIDDRIIFEVNEKNLGLPLTLNKMLEKVETEYIARMDADDIAKDDRFEKQYNYMKENDDVDLCGTNIIYIDNDGNQIHKKQSLPENNDEIRKTLSYLDVLCHPTFFAKSKVLKKVRYRNLKYAQDYDLVCRLEEKKYILANINEYLLNYRTGNVGAKKMLEQRITAGEIQRFYRKQRLCEIDISKIVSDKVLKLNEKSINNYKKSCDIYETGVVLIKKHNYVKGISIIIISLLHSKYQVENFFNMIKYKLCIKKF